MAFFFCSNKEELLVLYHNLFSFKKTYSNTIPDANIILTRKNNHKKLRYLYNQNKKDKIGHHKVIKDLSTLIYSAGVY